MGNKIQPKLARALFAASAVASMLAASALSARGADTDNFRIRSASDLVALCSTQPGQDNYVAAIHFCQGFASGAYQYYQASTERDPAQRFVCPPNPPPSRNDAIASYLVWARAHPDTMSASAVDSIFRYLGETYPCSSGQQPPARH